MAFRNALIHVIRSYPTVIGNKSLTGSACVMQSNSKNPNRMPLGPERIPLGTKIPPPNEDQDLSSAKKFVPSSGGKIELTKWFPRHMYSGLKKMQAKLRNVDCVIEVHDARIPLCGRNPEFYKTLYAIKPHILVLNKEDLIDPSHKAPVEEILFQHYPVKHVVWTNLRTRREKSVEKVMSLAFKEINDMPRYNKMYKTEYTIMVIGIPNTGKSTLINALRTKFTKIKGQPAATGNKPGITKKVMEKIRVHENPLVYILDTPGVVMPDFRSLEIGMKMALCETILENQVDSAVLAEYMLFFMNNIGNYSYVEKLKLDRPYEIGLEFLAAVAKAFDMKKMVPYPGEGVTYRPNYSGAVGKVLGMFRRNEFGDQFLDADEVLKFQTSNSLPVKSRIL